jgi:predicted ATPase
MLNQVHFENIKSLADVTIDLERLTVLVGPNGCGKSTVLDQVDRLCAFSQPAPYDAKRREFDQRLRRELVVGSGRCRRFASKTPMVWRGRFTNGTSLLSLVHSEVPDGLEDLELAIFDEVVLARLNSRHSSEHLLPVPGDQVAPRLLWENPDYGNDVYAPVTASLGDLEREDYSDSLERILSTKATKSSRLRLSPWAIAKDSPFALEPSLRADGFGLPSVLSYMRGRDPEVVEAITRDLRAVVPQVRQLHFNPVNMESEHPLFPPPLGMTMQISFAGGAKVPADQVSDGTLITLALLTALHAKGEPSVILLDDIDHGLHLSAQYTLIKAIRGVMEARPELQIICTSHAPVLLDSFDVKEVRVMALDKDGATRVRPLSEAPGFER